MVVMTHASNVTGAIQPIAEYGHITRAYRLIFMVDAAQTAGKYPLNVVAENIDLLACSGHKGLFGPPGTGLLYIGDAVHLDSLREGGTGTQSELEEQPDTLPDKYESGTLNSVGISGLGAGIQYLVQEGLHNIAAREHALIDRLIKGLAQIPNVTLYIAPTGGEQAPVVSCTITGYTPGEVGALLDQAFDIIKYAPDCIALPQRTKLWGRIPAEQFDSAWVILPRRKILTARSRPCRRLQPRQYNQRFYPTGQI
ncbi:cysteine desulfurase family protein [Candidatus Vecturithrix granuli]|uniref:Cysteine desulfurase family protein n=1 Tax=Vecturithrix granuli TaxID=1499967 RepID=A0A081BZI0_VECG1|nr:cysteine desulfurase family protein [Candidatus Vecturithrix granuli]